jgi:uncharacterized membrane protein (UPF0127 family)
MQASRCFLRVETKPPISHSEIMKQFFLVTVCLGLALGSGCSQTPGSTAAPVADPGEPTEAQHGLQTMKIYIQSEVMEAELAVTARQERTGMMYRTNMAENAGMLFPLPFTQRASFWMKHCPLPLSAAYIDEDGVIQEIHDLQAYNTNPVVAASDNIRFVLETPQGWFQRHHIAPGVSITTERGPLMRTFFGR